MSNSFSLYLLLICMFFIFKRSNSYYVFVISSLHQIPDEKIVMKWRYNNWPCGMSFNLPAYMLYLNNHFKHMINMQVFRYENMNYQKSDWYTNQLSINTTHCSYAVTCSTIQEQPNIHFGGVFIY